MGFHIYNASAGSGKTATLTRVYLSILLKYPANQRPLIFREILAITFTNKAVAEFKKRILDYLMIFSQHTDKEYYMMSALCEEINITPQELHIRAKQMLSNIIHHYSYFNICTIDKFNHMIVKAFSMDFRLPANFRIELDTQLCISKAIDNTLLELGKDEQLSSIVISFIKNQIEDNKSYRIKYSVSEFLKNINSAKNTQHYYQRIKDKEPLEFVNIHKHIATETQRIRQSVLKIAKDICDAFSENGIDKSFFNGGHYYKFFEGIHASKSFKASNMKNDADWKSSILENNTMKDPTAGFQKSNPEGMALLEQLNGYFVKKYQQIYTAITEYFHYKNLLKNYASVSLFARIYKELDRMKEEESFMFLSDFEQLIADKVRDQPAPFIYERLGERYQYFFIDEFQDTSIVQWNNLIPLIANAVESTYQNQESGELYIVGDAKQSIYRFRGGVPEQFIDLYNRDDHPFQIPAQTSSLSYNYRSHDEIINFNNTFFQYIQKYAPTETYKQLYQNSTQKIKQPKPHGYVQIDIIEECSGEEKQKLYLQKIKDIITKLQQEQWALSDICILVNRVKQGKIIAQHLQGLENPIGVISAESFLLKESTSVILIINFLKWSLYPEDNAIRFDIVHYLLQRQQPEVSHTDLQSTIEHFEEKILRHHQFSLEVFSESTLYQSIIYLIDCFAIPWDDYVGSFLQLIHELSIQYHWGIPQFLDYWEEHQEKLITGNTNNSGNALQIMTIHKSKGLDFPIVIYPFVNDTISIKGDYLWEDIPYQKETTPAAISYVKDAHYYNEAIHQQMNTLEQENTFDRINNLYVCFTRTRYHNYIITEQHTKEPKTINQKDIIHDYLVEQGLYDDQQQSYQWGDKQNKEITINKKPSAPNDTHHQTVSYHISQQQTKAKLVPLHQTPYEDNIKGNLFHDILTDIYTAQDIENALRKHLNSDEDINYYHHILDTIFADPLLKPYFQENITILNERTFVTKDNETFRPDRIVINANAKEATIIDYKTGVKKKQDILQISNYAQHLSEMGWNVNKKFLIYIEDQKVEVLEV